MSLALGDMDRTRKLPLCMAPPAMTQGFFKPLRCSDRPIPTHSCPCTLLLPQDSVALLASLPLQVRATLLEAAKLAAPAFRAGLLRSPMPVRW